VTAGRLAGRASVLSGRGGATSLPGLVAVRIAPDIAATLASELPHGSIVVAGTNGKTTTAALLAAVLRADGLRPVHNRAGANLLHGVASTLLAQVEPGGRLRAGPDAIGLFEADEAALPAIMRAVRPSLLVVTNLFRDQLDRYGELDGIATRWRAAIAALPEAAGLVLNADDPLVASLDAGAGRRVIYYGLELPAGRFDRPPESADSISCRRCGALLDYARVYYGHLGHYRCPRCSWERPQPTVRGCAAEPHGLDGSRLEALVEDVGVTVELRVPGLYNAYNALAALAGACSRGMDVRRAAGALQEVRTAFGRAECVRVGGHDVWLLLVKNPTGCDEVLRLLAGLPAPLDLLAILNDNAADGHDISWIWDTAIEDVVGRLRRVTFAGTRAEDMALRFKYAGYSATDSPILRDPLAALEAAVAATPPGAPLYVVATYTAMLEVRRGLVKRGLLRHYLDEQATGDRRR
jgi:UDP-N-acetylmuramyl tripeptide synthase